MRGRPKESSSYLELAPERFTGGETDAALALHSAVLVLSSPGLAAEAVEQGVPLEVIEGRAVRSAAQDISRSYGLDEQRAYSVISGIVARYGE